MSPTHPPFRAPSAVVDSCCGLAPKQWFTITKCHTTRCDGQVDLDLVNEANDRIPNDMRNNTRNHKVEHTTLVLQSGRLFC